MPAEQSQISRDMTEILKVILLRLPQVELATGLKKSALHELINAGDFPRPVKLGSRSVAWRSDEVQAWIESRPRVTAARSAKEAAE